MTKKELDEILNRHKHWLNKDCDGWENMRADLSDANLRRADLSYADLRHANLRRADLSGADLSGADLSGADLRRADLSGADLSGADLSYADLSGADLSYADLDYSCIPLWCGSLTAHFDDKQIKQIAFHLVKAGLQSKNTSDEVKQELRKLIDLANGFHRVEECGVIE